MEKNSFKNILDESNQLIQVSSIDDFRMMYANKPAIQFTNRNNQPYEGQHCYQYMMGLDEQCPFCPMHQMEKNEYGKETEIDNGNQVYKVKTVIAEWDGKPAFIEYATDITLARRAQEIYSKDMSRLLHSIPEARGIYHLNLVQNTCDCLRTETLVVDTVDELIEQLSTLLASSKDGVELKRRFNRDHLIEAFEQGKSDVVMESICGGISGIDQHWVRITARNLVNPNSGDLESFLYVLDVNNEKKLEEIAKHDALTGLYNKKTFEDTVTKALEKNPNAPKAIVFFDLDHFKDINDNFGHLVGDMVLNNVGIQLLNVFSDLDIISRFGGDEFCIYLENISQENLCAKLTRLFDHLQPKEGEDLKKVGFTASIGIAYLKEGTQDYKHMLEVADKALYQAKEEGRNRIIITEL